MLMSSVVLAYVAGFKLWAKASLIVAVTGASSQRGRH
jgi:hypothetical protein